MHDCNTILWMGFIENQKIIKNHCNYWSCYCFDVFYVFGLWNNRMKHSYLRFFTTGLKSHPNVKNLDYMPPYQVINVFNSNLSTYIYEWLAWLPWNNLFFWFLNDRFGCTGIPCFANFLMIYLVVLKYLVFLISERPVWLNWNTLFF